MTDVFSQKERSQIMSKIRSRGNKATELRFVTILRSHKISGWRRGSKLPGQPDFVFPARHLAVFIDGCFWHGCPRCYHRPKSNCKYWDAKVERNRKRDRAVCRELKARGWKVTRIWQHQLKKPIPIVRQLFKNLIV